MTWFHARRVLRCMLYPLATAILGSGAMPAIAQPTEGGLYIAGDGFSFARAAAQALGANPEGQRFFLLSLPPETRALETATTGSVAAVRDRVVASGGVLYVCQRDVDRGKVDLARLVPGVVAVRGWPSGGSSATMPPGERYFQGENRAVLPASNDSLRRLRASCSD